LRIRRAALAAVVVAWLGLQVAGCADSDDRSPLDQAIAVNQSRHVAETFEEHPVVIDDTKGLSSLRLFFPRSEILVVSDSTVEAQLRAASIAVYAHAPMIVYDSAWHQEISQEIERLKTHTVLTVGEVNVARTTGRVNVHRDPGGLDGVGQMLSVQFREKVIADPADAAEVVAVLDAKEPVLLRAAWDTPKVMPGAEAEPFPISSRRDADMAPVVVATKDSSIASIANARSFGAAVTLVDNPDPRESRYTLFTMAGLAERPLLALGAQFGDDQTLAARIMQAEEFYRSAESDTEQAGN